MRTIYRRSFLYLNPRPTDLKGPSIYLILRSHRRVHVRKGENES